MSVIIACALAAVNTSLSAAANNNGDKEKKCSNQTLNGDYGFTIEGLLDFPQPGTQVRGVVLQHYDGNGHITQVDHVVEGGVPPTEEWRPGTGTYMVNSDCTGKATITITPGVPPLVLYFVVVRQGKEIRQVVNAGAVIATGNRVD